MTQPFPHPYEATLEWEQDSRAALSAGIRPILVGGPPPEFDGGPNGWSPEHLLRYASNLCLMSTHMVVAKKAGIRAPAARVGEARTLLDTAKRYCIVSNSLKRPVEVEGQVDPVEG